MIFTSSCCDNLSIDEIIERAEKGDCEAQYIVGFYYNRDSAIDSPDDERPFTGWSWPLSKVIVKHSIP